MRVNRTMLVILRSPTGVELDVTSRVTQFGALSDSIEGDELTELVHADVDFTLDDRDGVVADYFENTAAGEEWIAEIWRETGQRRPKYELLFSGLLDLPWSLGFDDKEKTVTVQVFGQSKRLELESAEDVKRDVTGRTGTVSAGSATVTVSDGTDLQAGDEITLSNDTDEETHTILGVSGVTVTTTETWDTAFTDAMLTLETPYYRNASVSFLVDELFTAAGIDSYTLVETQVVGETPFGSRSSADAADEWSLDPDQDGVEDAAEDVYTAEVRGVSPQSIWVMKNGVDDQQIGPFPAGDGISLGSHPVDLDPVNNRVWIAFAHYDLSLDADRERLSYYNVGGGGVTGVYNNIVGQTYPYNVAFVHELIPTVCVESFIGSAVPSPVKRYNATTGSGTPIDTVTFPINPQMSTLNSFDGKMRAAVLYFTGGLAYVRIWNISTGTWVSEGDYLVAEETGTATAQTYYTGNEWVWWGSVGTGPSYFLVSRSFGGVIPYADFEGLSCGAALRELAILTGSFVTVDEFGIGSFVPRSYVIRDRSTEELADPIDMQRKSLSENYRDSVKVAGTAADDTDFEVVAGVRGDPSKQLEISSPLIQEEPLAEAVAALYASLLGSVVPQAEATVREPAERLRPLDRIRLAGRDWDVLDAELDLEDETQKVKLRGVA